MTITTATDVEATLLQMDASGAPVRLEWVRGRFKVEASPASRHQLTIDRIRATLRPLPGAASNCGCFSLADVLFRFPDPDSSLKRPDIAIVCEAPPEVDEALDLLPAAVIEILSLGYEEKDLGEDGAAFYLSCGVVDVLIVDPRTKRTLHYRLGQPEPVQYDSPRVVTLACGCVVEI